MEEIIKNSETLAQAVREIFGFDNGTSRRKMKKLIEDNNIDISHLRSKPLIYKRIIKKCPVCGKEFEGLIGSARQKTTCSYSCSNTHFRSGENNPNWRDEVSDYNTKKYRTICFNNHKKECIVCGENKIVAVHHYDENHENNSIENLIPLCPTHHQYVHSRYKDEVIDTINKYREEFISKNNLGT
jgi:hypothetical protein